MSTDKPREWSTKHSAKEIIEKFGNSPCPTDQDSPWVALTEANGAYLAERWRSDAALTCMTKERDQLLQQRADLLAEVERLTEALSGVNKPHGWTDKKTDQS